MRNFTVNALMLGSTMAVIVGCYSLTLRVSGERAAVQKLKGQLVADNHDIRTLQTELGNRSRPHELQRWNDSMPTLQMKIPAAAQYLRDPVQLAGFVKPRDDGGAMLHYAVTRTPGAQPVEPAPPAALPAQPPLVRVAYTAPSRATPRAPAVDLDAMVADASAHDGGQ